MVEEEADHRSIAGRMEKKSDAPLTRRTVGTKLRDWIGIV